MPTLAERLPEEVLLMIFENVYDNDVYELQQVCRAWYSAAHAMSLRDISLFDSRHVQQFIRSIDSNLRPTYLAAVTDIRIYNTDHSKYVLTTEEIRKTFFRFPNLKRVIIKGSMYMFQKMTEALCQEFLTRCPKLEKFSLDEYNENDPKVYEQSYTVRPLVTTLSINEQINETVYKTDVMQYITGFSRLRVLSVDTEALDNFGKFLTAFEHLPYLDSFKILHANEDHAYFAENFLATMTQEKQDQLITRLSQLKKLLWRRESGACMHTIKFIQKYLTGLTMLSLYVQLDQHSQNIEQQIFCKILMELVCSINECCVFLKMQLAPLASYLPLVLTKLFYNPAITSKNKKTCTLRLRITDFDLEDHTMTKLEVRTAKGMDVIVSVSTAVNLEDVATNIFSMDAPLENVENFYIAIDNRLNSTTEANAIIYCKILEGMKSLKSVTVDVGASFQELPEPFDINTEACPLVENLTINATSSGKFQTLLRQFVLAFPNVQNLAIRYFCGDWDRWLGEFRLLLPSYSLKKLTIDVTPVMVKTMNHLGKQNITPEGFFVIQVELRKSKLCLFKVQLNSLQVKRINSKNIEGWERGQDYIRLHIIAHNLERLVLRRNTDSYRKIQAEQYFDNQHSRSLWETIVLDNVADWQSVPS